jgi:hypothetical protein
MPSRFKRFDRSGLKTAPLSERKHQLDLSAVLPLQGRTEVRKELQLTAEKIVAARSSRSAVIMMLGAHVIRSGVQRFLIDMMEKGYITCIAVNGAVVIHDFELSLIGATTESVADYIRNGAFGLWQETGRINDIVCAAAKEGMGLGEAVGRIIEEEHFPHREVSILGAGYRLGIPITVHVGIGYDIVFEHPNCDGASYGAASYTDFLIFARALESLKGGVVMSFGSAVMAPEIFMKALAMVRNAASREHRQIDDFTTLVCDLVNLPQDYRTEASPEKPEYYFRPWKTLLVRTLSGGGESYYVRGHHAETIPQLWTAIQSEKKE